MREEAEPTLDELCARLSPCDLVLIEGYKFSDIPKIEVRRSVTGHPPLYPDDAQIIAVATDSTETLPLPRLHIDAPQQVADHILEYFSFRQA